MSETPLRRRIAPSVPLTLELRDDSGSTFLRSFRLSFDFNCIALIEERTGQNTLDEQFWKKISGRTLSVMFWASVLAQHPEYDSDEGLSIVRSYMDPSNVPAITEAIRKAYLAGQPEVGAAQVPGKGSLGQETVADPTKAAPTPAAPELRIIAGPSGSTSANSGPSPATT